MTCAFAQFVELPRESTQSDNDKNPLFAMLSPEKDDDDWSYSSSMKIMETNDHDFSFLDTSIDSVSDRSKPIGQIAVVDGGTDSVVIGRS